MIINKMDNKGRGITYYNNKIVFVNNALPGEDVEIKIILDKKKYSIADVIKYNKKSKLRIKGLCKYYNVCGGCQLQHLSYQDQINYKKNYLNELFSQINIKIKEIVHSNQFNYRNKITLKCEKKIGFYKLNSNKIINIDNCLIANNRINAKLKMLHELINTNNIDEIIIKTFNEKTMLVLNGKEINTNLNNILDLFDTIYINDNLIKGQKLIATIDNIKYYVAPNSFFQVNLNITEKMFNYIKKICNDSNYVLDLYCGCGSISLFIASKVKFVYGVEINKQSIKDALENQKINKIENAFFKCDTTNNININNKFDTLIVDPPRSGLSNIVINKILNSKIKKIIYVSCDPITLNRDICLLKEKYDILDICVFDMFPNTYHVESVILLQKKDK